MRPPQNFWLPHRSRILHQYKCTDTPSAQYSTLHGWLGWSSCLLEMGWLHSRYATHTGGKIPEQLSVVLPFLCPNELDYGWFQASANVTLEFTFGAQHFFIQFNHYYQSPRGHYTVLSTQAPCSRVRFGSPMRYMPNYFRNECFW